MSTYKRKYAQLDSLLDEYGASSVWFATAPGFAWLTGGDNTVSTTDETGVAAAGYDGRGIEVVVDHIEADRIIEEELEVEAEVETFDWYDDELATVVTRRATSPAITDFDVPELETLEFSPNSLRLTPKEQSRYRELGVETAEVVEGVAKNITPVTTERSVAGELARKLRKRGIAPVVVLVGGAKRSQLYRHFVPKDRPLGDYAILTVGGRRTGLHVSLTRTVAFDPPEWLEKRHRAACRVSSSAIRATQGARGERSDEKRVFDVIKTAYAAVGYPDEWHNHHQGGPTGYRGREWLANPREERPIRLPKAFAWNPTIAGTKSEDTVLITDKAVETLTVTGDWPTVSASPIDGDEPVIHHDIFSR